MLPLKIEPSERRDVCGKLAKSLQEYCLPGTESNKDVLLPLTEGVLDHNTGMWRVECAVCSVQCVV